MPVATTYPGVYIEEIPSSVRTITGVATSIAAFIGFFERGMMNQPVQILNMGDFTRYFGGLHLQSEASYAIQQFFLNGGAEAWVVRTASGSVAAADVQIQASIAGATSLTIQAGQLDPTSHPHSINPGIWGNNLRVRIDYPMPTSGDRFNMTVSLVEARGGREVVIQSEQYLGLTMSSIDTRFVQTVVNDRFSGSKLIRVSATGNDRPLQNGTTSGELDPFPAITITNNPPQVNVSIGADDSGIATLSRVPATLADARTLLESAIRGARPDRRAFSEASVSIVDNRLRILAGPTESTNSRIIFGTALLDGTTVGELLLDPAHAQANVQAYALGAGAAIGDTAQGTGTPGNDGALPDGTSLIGDLNSKTGIFAFEDVDLFNILCIPRAAIIAGANALTALESSAVMSAAISYCERRRAFFIMDTPTGIDEIQEVKDWLEFNDTLRHRNAALYFPRIQIPDPLNEFRPRSIGASGTIAGLFARTDSDRGVWKAPAGTEARLRNVRRLDYSMTDSQNGTLNPIAINCLRNFPVYGNICWGARTLDGSDQQASEWKYVPVRRLALFLEESLYRGTKWVVFEPNDEPLWSQIRLNIGAFMHNLFRQGAFQGSTPRDAYLVKCDKETTTQNHINSGIVNIIVGFAPLKPAEFVIISIQQMAGQIEV